MKSFRDQTYYELLEVQPSAAPDEVRAALQRALQLCAPDSVALYALVEESQAEALRLRLEDAGRVLLDPAARAGYDRMLEVLPREPPPDSALWTEDEDDQGPPTSVGQGPYAQRESASLDEVEASGAAVAQTSLPLDAGPPRWPVRPPGLPSPRPRPAPGAVAAQPSPEASEAPAGAAGPAAAGAAAAETPAPVAERPRMPDLPPEVEFNGELLRQVREARGLTLQQLADRTRIGRSHLEKVEADRYADLPAPVYLRGILVSLARELKLDATRVSKSYMLLAERAGRQEP